VRPLLLIPLLGACTSSDKAGDTTDTGPSGDDAAPVALRIATFNVAMHRGAEGALVEELATGESEQARQVAAVLQELRPDVVLLNEVDSDADAQAVQLLHELYLAVSQDGREPLDYPYTLAPPVNTGQPSGVDLDGDGTVETTPGSDAYAQDCFGYGEFPGQYGLAVLSRHDFAGSRTFQNTLWADLPGNIMPEGYYSPEAEAVLRLSSKTHLDLQLDVLGNPLHLLASHPTPPSFDGDEDRNGRRNHDEIVFWAHYLDAGADGWMVDDAGVQGGLGAAPFVILGDLNADPFDGGSTDDPMGTLFDHPRINGEVHPRSEGGAEAAASQGGVNGRHEGNPACDTADFSDGSVGNLRVDHVLPSVELEVTDSGVFWPGSEAPMAELVDAVSDHRLVWIDVVVGG
jgi:endonuclease/exonuclease/phosphatase family metal-dependent hydrolase